MDLWPCIVDLVLSAFSRDAKPEKFVILSSGQKIVSKSQQSINKTQKIHLK